MRVGIRVPQSGPLARIATVREIASEAEAAGFASIWLGDQVVGDAVLDPLGALHAAATATRRLRLGTAVVAGSWYSPLVLARALTTLDHASAGRLTVGLGLGRSREESAAVGVSRRYLGARFEELLDVLDAAWGGDPVEHAGARVRIAPTTVQPKPVQRPRPPVLLAASTPRGLDRVARRADGWLASDLPAESIAPMWRAVLEMAGGYERQPAALALVVCVAPDDAGSVAALAPDEIVVDVGASCDSVGALLARGIEARDRVLDAVDEPL